MARPDQDINYWPGYVDALMNVVINLLFLVALLTVGVLMTNWEAIELQKTRVQGYVQKLLHEERGQYRQEKARQLMRAPLHLPPEPQVLDLPKLEIKEFRIYRQDVVLQNDSDLTRKPAQPQTTKPQPIAVPSKPLVEQMAQQQTNGRIAASFTFAPEQFELPSDMPWPTAIGADTSAHWTLVVITDPSNPRLAREAFARLISVRHRMVQNGIPQASIKLRIAPTPDNATLPEHADLRVFVMAPAN